MTLFQTMCTLSLNQNMRFTELYFDHKIEFSLQLIQIQKNIIISKHERYKTTFPI